MTNHFAFECPITQSAEKLADCEDRHTRMMQGKHEEIEPRICAVAHLCWMCPTRSAFRVGGPWSKPDKKPRWDEPRERPAKLPKEITDHALRNTLPADRDYRRAGIGEGTIFNDHLSKIQAGTASQPPLDVLARKQEQPAPKPKEKAKSRVQKKSDEKTMSKPKPAPKAQKAPGGKKLSLAERAKLMKEKRQAAGG